MTIPKARSQRWCAVALALCAAALSTSASAHGAVETVATTDGPILAYAADDGRLAWITFKRARRCYGVVHQHVLRTGADIVLGRPGFGSQCAYDNVNVAVAGSRVLWSWFWWPCDCMSSFGKVVTGAPGRGKRVVEELQGFDFSSIGDWVMEMSGDGETLVYGTITTDYLDIDEGTILIIGGLVRRVMPARTRNIPQAGDPYALSVSGTRVAVVNASDASGDVDSLENGPVHIRHVGTGGLVATIVPTGFTRTVALGRERAALMVDKTDGTKHLEVYDAGSGAPVTSFQLAPGVAAELDLDQGRVVYHRGKVIKVFAGGESRVLAIASAQPIGLSIEGRRVTWAENVGGRGRIRSVMVAD